MKKQTRMPVAAALVLGLQLAACSSDEGSNAEGGSGTDLIAGGAQGIYQLSSSTQNEAGCDVEGASKLDDMQTKFVYLVNDMGTVPYVQLAFCIGPEHCREVRERSMTEAAYNIDGFEFFQSPAGGFMARDVLGSRNMAGQCTGGTWNRYEIVMDGNAFEAKWRRGAPPPAFAPDADGVCWNIQFRDDVPDGTCEEYRVFRGSFSEPL